MIIALVTQISLWPDAPHAVHELHLNNSVAFPLFPPICALGIEGGKKPLESNGPMTKDIRLIVVFIGPAVKFKRLGFQQEAECRRIEVTGARPEKETG
jgi:hypothetical protein